MPFRTAYSPFRRRLPSRRAASAWMACLLAAGCSPPDLPTVRSGGTGGTVEQLKASVVAGDLTRSLMRERLDAQAFAADQAALHAMGSRVVGQPGHAVVHGWIRTWAAELRSLGASAGLEVFEQPFTQAAPVEEAVRAMQDRPGAFAVLPGRDDLIRLHPLWPNGVMPSSVPEGGLELRVINGGNGQLSAFMGRSVPGSAVLLNLRNSQRWHTAAMLGARAILFYHDEPIDRSTGSFRLPATTSDLEHCFSQIPVNVPRYLVGREDVAQLRDVARNAGTIRIEGRVSWRQVPCTNHLLLLPGQGRAARDLIVLAAPLDAMSVVPGLPTGAEAGLGLLTAMRYFEDLTRAVVEGRATADRASVLLLLTDAQHHAAAGPRAFAHMLAYGSDALAARRPERVSSAQRFLATDRFTLAEQVRMVRGGLEAVEAGSAAGLDAMAAEWLGEQLRRRATRRRVDSIAIYNRLERERSTPPERLRHAARVRDYFKYLQDLDDLDEQLRSLREQPDWYDAATVSEFGPPIRSADFAAELNGQLERAEQLSLRADQDLAIATRLAEFRFAGYYEVAVSGGAQGFCITANPTHNSAGPGGDFRWQMEAYHRRLRARMADLLRLAELDMPNPILDAMSLSGVSEEGNRAAPHASGVGALMLVNGKSAFVLHPVNDARDALDTPFDLPDRIDMPNATRLSAAMRGVLTQFIFDPGSRPASRVNGGDLLLRGRCVTFDLREGLAADKPVPGAVVHFPRNYANTSDALQGKSVHGMRLDMFAVADGDGRYEFRMVEQADRQRAGFDPPVHAFVVDPVRAAITHAVDHGPQSAGRFVYRFNQKLREVALPLVLFRCEAIEIFDFIDARYLNQLTQLRVLDAATGGEPNKYSEFFPPTAWGRGTTADSMAVLFGEPGARLQMLLSEGLIGLRLALLNNSLDNASGVGYAVAGTRQADGAVDPFAIGPDHNVHRIGLTAFEGAKSFFFLNETRLSQLRAAGVFNEALATLQRGAAEQIALAQTHVEKGHLADAYATSRAALGLTARAYPDVAAMADDAVVGVIFYLALLVPFAWFMERLTFRYKGANQRLVGMAIWFVAIFVVLFQVHPAFKISLNPLIILLAFIMFVLAIVVLSILGRKFAAVVREYREKLGGVHSADVSRASALMVAVSLALSNMHRRKVRTVLTGVTLVLLSFAIVSFSSIQSDQQPFASPIPDVTPAYDGLVFRMDGWRTVPEPVLNALSAEFEDQLVLGRYWAQREERVWNSQLAGANRRRLTREIDGQVRTASIEGLIGMESAEQRLWPVQQFVRGRLGQDGEFRFFEPGERYGRVIILPAPVADRLLIQPEDLAADSSPVLVRMDGVPFRVIGVLDPERADAALDISGNSMAPCDFAASGMSGNEAADMARAGQTDLDTPSIHLPFEITAIIPAGTALQMNGRLKSVAVRFNDDLPLMERKQRIEQLMDRLAVNIFAAIDGRSFLYSSVGLSSVDASGKLIVPILLAILIILNTMLGTVAERLEEIGMYNSVGLAPAHVTALFLVEAAVFANLGVVLGFLLGQILADLNLRFEILQDLSLNYSGSATVLANAVIIAVTLFSAWYPARKAGQLANPGLATRWRLPEPEGNELELLLPFTLTRGNALGIFAFLAEYFAAHRESTSPDFRCGPPRTAASTDSLHMHMRVWLAPYDLGVSQDLTAIVEPTEHTDIYRVRFVLHRRSGDVSAWMRTTTAFLNLIRKQFLIWRTIDAAGKKTYLDQARALFTAPVQQAGKPGRVAGGAEPAGAHG